MGANTSIEWTRGDDGTPGSTWNPVTGCTKVSPGCDHCYAETITERFHGKGSFANVTLHPDRLDLPLRWRKPRKVFVNSMSDLFHEQVPDAFIGSVWDVMARSPRHTFQILTKRHARMRSFLRQWPNYVGLPNVWLGVSVEDQKWADIRIPALLDTPAAVRFLSCEPLLGPVDLRGALGFSYDDQATGERVPVPAVDWVICGGESGKGARPMHPEWARNLRDQCGTAAVSFLFKQRGEWTWNEHGEFRTPPPPFTERTAVMHPAGMTAMTKGNPFDPFERGHPDWSTRITRVGKKAAGRLLDGRTWDEYP